MQHFRGLVNQPYFLEFFYLQALSGEDENIELKQYFL